MGFNHYFQKTPTFPELVKVLSHFCCNPDPDDINAFDSAVLLGRLCVADENAKLKLQRALNQTKDTHLKAKVSHSDQQAYMHHIQQGPQTLIFAMWNLKMWLKEIILLVVIFFTYDLQWNQICVGSSLLFHDFLVPKKVAKTIKTRIKKIILAPFLVNNS